MLTAQLNRQSSFGLVRGTITIVSLRLRLHRTGSLLIGYKSVPFPSRLHCTGTGSEQCRYLVQCKRNLTCHRVGGDSW